MPALELWGGVECTVNRVGDQYFDQLERNGHAARLSDLDLFAGLGIRALRYPVLWERAAPSGPESADWRWTDERLGRLRELGIRPIAGLVHHGSGPRHTSLVSPCFAEGLARYARAVAERYPWVDSYTPVNEPLTTARFAGLYGHWYPHGRDNASFVRALVNQCRGTVLAMRAVREVNPRAALVQTDDLGKTFSTPALAYQAAFDNERRWLGWDLVCGRVDREHLLWDTLLLDGIHQAELEWFLQNPCPPDVIGVNHYVTSDRFLDERLDRYPSHTHGGNCLQAYADVEAVRVRAEGPAGPEVLLREAWERYRIPLAVTEAHLGCTRDEQVRWLLEVWRAAQSVRRDGADVRAVTAWSLLGAYDWDSLLTRAGGAYEPGAFDLRGGVPRPTALAAALRDLAGGREPDHPVLSVPGWWRRPERLLYPPFSVSEARPEVPDAAEEAPEERPRGNRRPGLLAPSGGVVSPRPLLITGAEEMLGQAFARICDVRGLPHRLLGRRDIDTAVGFSIEDALDEVQPWAVVNAAEYGRVDDAEREPERCFRENTDGPAVLAAVCARRGIPLVTFSSDRVFDGNRDTPYVEGDPVGPLGVYGRSKAEAEQRVLSVFPGALVVRSGAFFGPWDEEDALTAALRELEAGRSVAAAADRVVSPTYVPDLAHACLDLLMDGETGIWHLANQGAVSPWELVRLAAGRVGLDAARLQGRAVAPPGLLGPRPRFSVLGSERALLLPSLEDALGCYFQDREVAQRDARPRRSRRRAACLS